MGRKTLEEMPDVLYKYYCNIDFVLEVIHDNKIYFSNPIKHFNDPFDCRLELEMEGTVNEWEKRIARTAKAKKMRKLKPTDLTKAALEQKKAMDDPETRRTVVENVLKPVGMFCLSGSKDDILMYSHYSNNHKGVCLAFDLRKNINQLISRLRVLVQPINYKSEYTPLKYVKNSSEELVEFNLFTKSERWKCEDELRIVDTQNYGNHDIPEQMLVEIIFGCQAKEEDKERIIEANNMRKYPARVYSTEKVYGAFRLERFEIE